MNIKRIQLTLFVDEIESVAIEKIRKEFNPEQYALIKSHVTICREDELEQLESVLLNLENLHLKCIAINFGNAVRFSNGKGVLIPGVGNNESFQKLREQVLRGVVEKPRIHEPHITLMHPGNATCTDAIFKQIAKCKFPSKIKFRDISLIEQEPGMQWNILKRFELR
ncbi:MAG: 2'-5' RNA ligase family protein [Panacibacter sp.]